MVAQYFCFSFFADGHDCPPIDDSCPAAALMSPESAPELTALQKITAQKGTADRATVMAAHGGVSFTWHIGPFDLIRHGLQ